jgi:hypothetical protein
MARGAMSDDRLLQLVRTERQNSIGFENDADLSASRAEALNYYKGEMPDVPALANRSKVVSSDIADAVETLLPDLMEIFIGGDDVAVFLPIGEEDEDAAGQETDYINHVVFSENPGFMILYTMFKDAMLEKTGIVGFRWERSEDISEERFKGKAQIEMALAAQSGEVSEVETTVDDYTGQTLYDFTYRRTVTTNRCVVETVPPSDFTVAADTVRLGETTYCAMRSRPRAQELVADGIDPALVEKLPAHRIRADDQGIEEARDGAGETRSVLASAGSSDGLRVVETVTHFLRVDADGDGKLEIVRVLTGAEDTVLLDRETVERIPYAAITPFIVTHRFYGRSIADCLGEIQRIKTALMRMLLDSGYFALNQRVEVAMDRVSSFTISDLLRNEPGLPIRSKSGDAVRPIGAGGLGFDPEAALEYFSTVAEQRSGIVRNAQGLNPDTLHDTASGAMALMTMAQKRVRMIARIFAETGIKDLYLGVHAVIRENATEVCKVRLRGKWTPIDPTTFGERSDMSIEVGLGAAGRVQDQATMAQVSAMTEKIVAEQGGVDGPFVTAKNVYNVIKRMYEKLGIKTPELFVTDPATAPPAAPKPPSPEMQKVMLGAENDKQKILLDHQLKMQQAALEFELGKYKADQEARARTAAALMGGPAPSLPPVRFGGQVG